MIDDSPQTLLFLVIGAFATGWLVAKVSAYFGRRFSTTERDPRDDRIRSLDAELRIARNEKTKVVDALEAKQKELDDTLKKVDSHAATIKDQLSEINRLRNDLRESVQKTHELREELTNRAEENLRSTVKLQQVETELSVVRASSDLMSAGDLDYRVDDENDSDVPQIIKSGA